MGKTGHLTVSEIKQILKNKHIDYFVETGTYLGDSTLEASKVFKHVHTIEIMPLLYEQAKNKLNQRANITFHLGDTITILPGIADGIKDGCVWFIDAHQSGPETGNNGVCVPLLAELNIILGGIGKLNKSHIFIIDDVRLFSAFWDWADVSLQSIEKCFQGKNIIIKDKAVVNDRFIIYI